MPIKKHVLAGLLILVLSQFAFAAGETPYFFNYQSYMTNSSSVPLPTTTFSIEFRILDPSASCILYDETQPSVTSDSAAMISANVGTTTGSALRTSGTDPNISMATVFNNLSSTALVPNSANCTLGGGYIPAAGDVRLLRVIVNGTAITPDATIGAVPMAHVAETLQGIKASGFVQATGSVNQTSVAGVTAGAAIDASAYHNHNSLYSPIGGSASQNFTAQNEVVMGTLGVGTSTPTAPIEIEKSTGSTLIIGSTGTSGGNTMSLNFDSNTGGTTNASINVTDNSNTLKIQTGGTTAVTVNPNQSVSFANSIGLGGGLGLWSTNSTNDASYVATLGVGQEGTVWENNTTKNVRYWNGTAALNLAFQNVAGTGTTVGGTAIAPSVNVTYGTLANTAVQGNQAFVGDVNGSSGATVVAKIQTIPVSATAPTTNQVLTYNGTNWVALTPTTGFANTAGSVIFGAGGTTLTQDNTKFFWDDTNFRLGINAGNTPKNELSINAPVVTDALAHEMITTSAATNKALVLQEGVASPTGNMLEVQNNAGTVLYSIEATGTPTTNTDLINKNYFNATTATWGANYVRKDGTIALTATWDVGNQTIKNLAKFAVGSATASNLINVNSATTADALAQTLISTGVATNKGLVVQGVASQTANLVETQNSSGTVLAAIDAAGKLSLVNLAADPGGLTAADKGKVWFNSTANQIKYYDGTAIQILGVAGAGITSLNGLTASTQSFVNDTNVTIASATSTHTLGWAGTLALGRGGNGAALAPAGAGELVYSASTSALTSLPSGPAKRVLASNGAGAPVWSQDLSVDNTNHIINLDASGSVTGDGVVVSATPFASATTSLVRLGPTAIVGGNPNGTFMGANQAAVTSDYINFEAAGSTKFLVDKSGNISSSGAISASNGGTFGNLVTMTSAGGSANVVGLHVSAPVTGTNNSVSLMVDNTTSGGTNKGASVSFASDGTALFSVGADPTNNGTKSFYVWDNTNSLLRLAIDPNGLVGINQAAPTAQLEVDPNTATTIGQVIRAPASGTADLFDINNSSGTKQVYVDSNFVLHGNGSGLTGLSAAAAGASGSVQFSNGTNLTSSTKFFWDNTNNRLGIGTNTPSEPLSVIGVGGGADYIGLHISAPVTGAANTLYLMVDNTSSSNKAAAIEFASQGASLFETGTDVFGNGSKNFYIYDDVASETRFFIDPNGLVGINQTGPTGQLEIDSNLAGTTPLVIKEPAGATASLGTWYVNTTLMYGLNNSGTPSATTDLVSKAYSDATSTNLATNYLRKDGTTPLTANWSMGGFQLNNISGIGIGNTTPAALLDIGSAGATLGTMRLEGNTSGYVQIQPSAAAGSWTMTLPVSAGTSGYILQTNGSGVTSWVPPSAPTMSSLAGATSTDSINNANNSQTWAWNTLTSQTGLTLTTSNTGMAGGSVLAVTDSASSGNGNLLSLSTVAGSSIVPVNLNNLGNGTAIKVANSGTGAAATFTGGNVGIGTAAPTSQLHINGNGTGAGSGEVKLSSSGYNSGFFDTFYGAARVLDNGYSSNVGGDGVVYDQTGPLSYMELSSGNITFLTAVSGTAGNSASPVKVLTILNAGNVGIGNSTPTAFLDVAGSINTSTTYQIGETTYLAGNSNGVFVGSSAGPSNTGSGNTFVGNNAGSSNTSGYLNTYIGTSTGFQGTAAANNTIVGAQAASSGAYAGNDNVIIGTQAGLALTTANYDTLVGFQAGTALTTGGSNTVVGYLAAAKLTTAVSNTVMGYESGYNMTTGSGGNTLIGYLAGNDLTTGDSNTLVGFQAGQNFAGTGTGANAFFGFSAGRSDTTGNNNTNLGYQAGTSVTTGSGNVFIGMDSDSGSGAVSNAIAIGYNSTTQASTSTTIGEGASITGTSSTGSLALGYGAHVSVANAIQIGAGTNATTGTVQVGTQTIVDANYNLHGANVGLYVGYATFSTSSGYTGGKAACNGAYAGSHMCTVQEMIISGEEGLSSAVLTVVASGIYASDCSAFSVTTGTAATAWQNGKPAVGMTSCSAATSVACCQ